jgi:hypothetical protein
MEGVEMELSQHQHLEMHQEDSQLMMGMGGTARASTFPRPIAMNPNAVQSEFRSEFSTSPKPNKAKVRGRFSASRRREVQEVRKRGACIRCRMLKKPVSLLLSSSSIVVFYTDTISVPASPPAQPAKTSSLHAYGNNLAFEHVLQTS